MTFIELLTGYRRTTAARRYIVGLTLGEDVYYVDIRDLPDDWLSKTTSSGTKALKARLKLGKQKAEAVAKEYGAKYFCKASELVHPHWNRGQMFEKLFVERVVGREWHHDSTPFWVAGDCVLDGVETQIKLNGAASVVDENSLRRAMLEMGLA